MSCPTRISYLMEQPVRMTSNGMRCGNHRSDMRWFLLMSLTERLERTTNGGDHRGKHWDMARMASKQVGQEGGGKLRNNGESRTKPVILYCMVQADSPEAWSLSPTRRATCIRERVRRQRVAHSYVAQSSLQRRMYGEGYRDKVVRVGFAPR
jgi:hypothetical protein